MDRRRAGPCVAPPAPQRGRGRPSWLREELHAHVDLGTPGGRGRLRTLLRLVRAARRLGGSVPLDAWGSRALGAPPLSRCFSMARVDEQCCRGYRWPSRYLSLHAGDFLVWPADLSLVRMSKGS